MELDKRQPQKWLIRNCGFSIAKAFNLVHHKQKSISFKDLSVLCRKLHCTPNDLLYWRDEIGNPLEDTHPCKTQMTAPDPNLKWQTILQNMTTEQLRELKLEALKIIEKP